MKKQLTVKILILCCIGFVSIGIWSCKSSKTTSNKLTDKNLKILDSLLAKSDYRIDVDVMYPFNTNATNQVANVLLRNTGNNANRIDVRGDGHYIEIKNDSVKGHLPFFGERRLNAGPYGGANGGIQFEQKVENLEKDVIGDKGKLKIEFKAEQKGSDNDKYNITLELYPNKNVKIDISPTFRTFVRYDGRLVEFENEEK